LKILVVDDEPQIRRALKFFLEQNNCQVLVAASGEEGLDLAATSAPDLVILDLAMPGLNGFEVCRQLRTWMKTPIIVLSVRASEEDKIKVLDLGADDYLTKPFGMGELLARIRAVQRRASQAFDQSSSTFDSDELHVDFAHRIITVDGNEIHLTPKEYDLLQYLVSNANRVLTHRQLLTKVWGIEYADDTHTLRVHMANLRNKIEKNPERPKFITTEPRVGYRFRAKAD
jgi:two-component system KDP operon response regulator KdpE